MLTPQKVRTAHAVSEEVSIANFSFNPAVLTIHAGDVVTWTNNDQVIYQLWFYRADGSTLALSPYLSPGDMYTLSLNRCETIQYQEFHQYRWVRGEVRVLIPGEVNGDGIVNIIDLATVGAAFGSSTGQPGYNPAADLNKDGVINIIDLVTVGANFGKVCTP